MGIRQGDNSGMEKCNICREKMVPVEDAIPVRNQTADALEGARVIEVHLCEQCRIGLQGEL